MANVRVRIAPSPTGTPHVGTAYIALFNYCFAKSQGGDFILRIEDTDQKRSRPEFEEKILSALRWVGIQWDEGPDIGGEAGPYRQSERTDLYRKYADVLLSSDHAYKCFCSDDRLAQVRNERFKQGETTGYDGHCSHLSREEIREKQEKGLPYTIRLRVPPEGECKIHDPLRGEIVISYHTVDHQILLKSDQFPTYHLANVVDDHLMGITHVIRGEEWLPSLPKHMLLYEYLGFKMPEVYHLPLLRNADKSKLSKRKNPTSILFYRDIGILPETLLNFLGLMAYTLPSGEEFFKLKEMVDSFDIKRVGLSGPVFDQAKLTWLNQRHISSLSQEELLNRLISWKFNDSYINSLLPMMADRMHRLGDFFERCDFLFYSAVQVDKETLIPKKKEPEDTRDVLMKLTWELESASNFDQQTLESLFAKVSQIHGWSMRELTHAARRAVSGKSVAPPLFPVFEILGSDVVRNRLMQAVELLGPLGKKKLAKLQKAYLAQSASFESTES